MSLHPGDPVRVEITKWGGRPHWTFDATLLGSDEHGDWIGIPAGTRHARPGAALDSEVDSVTLVRPDDASLATFHAPGIWCDLYVDIATPAVFEGSVLRSVDLDLDVIRRPDGSVYTDDEDEFEEHRVSLAYPEEIVTMARTACAAVVVAVRSGAAPYDGAADYWLERLAREAR